MNNMVVKNGYTVVKKTNSWKYVFQYGMLALLCIFAFLVAKYIVRNDIDGEKIPIDTSESI